MKSWIFGSVLWGLAAAGCSGAPSATTISGNYSLMVTYKNVSDPVTMNVRQGSGGSILLSFSAGILPDPQGPSPDGIRANLSSTTSFDIPAQAAIIDHSTGRFSGTLTGTGSLDGTNFNATLHHMAASGFFNTDGGTTPLPDGGADFDYMLTGMKQ